MGVERSERIYNHNSNSIEGNQRWNYKYTRDIKYIARMPLGISTCWEMISGTNDICAEIPSFVEKNEASDLDLFISTFNDKYATGTIWCS